MGAAENVTDGAVVIAAITSCTNTSNPSVMLAAGLLAKKAVERGLTTHPYVKTSLAPGSRVVTDYLNAAELTPYVDALGFYTVGFGCTTCIAEGTPVLLANGTSRRIEQLPRTGGASSLRPTADGKLSITRQSETMDPGRARMHLTHIAGWPHAGLHARPQAALRGRALGARGRDSS